MSIPIGTKMLTKPPKQKSKIHFIIGYRQFQTTQKGTNLTLKQQFFETTDSLNL
jgi:hypothetical protein